MLHKVYDGVPVGKYQHHFVKELCASLDSGLKNSGKNKVKTHPGIGYINKFIGEEKGERFLKLIIPE